MKYLLFSITLLMSSSSMAVASNPFQNNMHNRGVQQGDNFLNYNSSVRRTNYIPPRGQIVETVDRGVRHQSQFRTNTQLQVNHARPIQNGFENRVNNIRPRVNHRQVMQNGFENRVNNVRPRGNAHKNSRFLQAEKAAKRGHPQAEFDLAMMYAKGDGVQKNPRVAFNLFHRAARKGHVDAKYCMAVNFDKGYGVIQQKELARYWYRIAAKAGHRGAKQRLAQLNKPIDKNNGLIMNAKYSRR